MRRCITTLAAFGATMTIVLAQHTVSTIPERVGRGENPVYLSINRELVDAPLVTLVAAATTIVEGTLTKTQTYLSDDKRFVYTDYVINPSLLVFQQKAKSSTTPGAQPMILKVWGGKLNFGGVEVVAVDENRHELKSNVPLILLLAPHDTDPSKFRLVGEVSGAFESTGGTIQPLVKGEWMLKAERGSSKHEFMKRLYDSRP